MLHTSSIYYLQIRYTHCPDQPGQTSQCPQPTPSLYTNLKSHPKLYFWHLRKTSFKILPSRPPVLPSRWYKDCHFGQQNDVKHSRFYPGVCRLFLFLLICYRGRVKLPSSSWSSHRMLESSSSELQHFSQTVLSLPSHSNLTYLSPYLQYSQSKLSTSLVIYRT